MGFISKKFEPLKLAIRHRLRWRFTRKEWFLGRHACLGYDSLNLMSKAPKGLNFQKGRVDLLLSLLSRPSCKPKASALKGLMQRKDIWPLIKQLEFFDALPKKAPKFIFMDSFAELTDQLFRNKRDGWLFACAYSDINHTPQFENEFESCGLLDVGKLEDRYTQLFEAFSARWGVVPILFLHFPIALEHRQLYIDRYQAIIEVIDRLTKRFPNLLPIRIDESEVAWPESTSEELKNFPYHYDPNTYEKFKVELEKTGLFS
jgi:hypothetical protein